MNSKVIEILADKISSDWERFARCSEFSNPLSVNTIIDQINNEDKCDNKSKLNCLLNKMYEHYPQDYMKYINSSLEQMDRNDVLQDLSNLDLSEKGKPLKNLYLNIYAKVNELQPPLKEPASVYLLDKFIDLCFVNAENAQLDALYNVDLIEFCKMQKKYTHIQFDSVFKKEKDLLLVSGIAGIGKSWLLRKCLLYWADNLIWKNVDFVFYFECRVLNRYQNISNIEELLDVFYKDFVNDLDLNKHNIVFMVDGLDEFEYLDDLIKHTSSCCYPIVNTLTEIQKYKVVVAGRVYAIDQYQRVSTEILDKLTVQVMGFNENGIKNYIKNNVIDGKKELIEATLKESVMAKAMAFVPFYLACMCKIIVESKQRKFSLLTMTDLYSSLFLYFMQKHIFSKQSDSNLKTEELVYEIIKKDCNKKYILLICKVAYELFVKGKVIFNEEEILNITREVGFNPKKLFGFIERIETHLGYHYQFAHYTIMEFCVSVYAFNTFRGEEIVANKKLKQCLPLICGLLNKVENNFIKFLDLNCSNNLKISMIHICDVSHNTFIQCFYESQSSLTDEIKLNVFKKRWVISINWTKSSYETSCENYFINHFINSQGTVFWLAVCALNLTNEEKSLIKKVSTRVRCVTFECCCSIDDWEPKNKIEFLHLFCGYRDKKKRKINFNKTYSPWINVCEILHIGILEENIHDFIDYYRKSNCCFHIKKLRVAYKGKTYTDFERFSEES